MNEETFLLYDYVHIMKCIRNNWLTERCGELEYEFNGEVQIAKWSDLNLLFEAESNSFIKLSKLTEVAISPKPIERQKVSVTVSTHEQENLYCIIFHYAYTVCHKLY